MKEKPHSVFRLFHERLSRERTRGPGDEARPDEISVSADFAPFVTLIERTETGFSEQQPDVSGLCPLSHSHKRYHWVKVTGTHDADFVQQVADCFSLHPLMVEDILEHGARPKLEMYDHRLFLVLRLLSYDEQRMRVYAEHVSIVADKHMLLTFQESSHNIWDELRQRMVQGLGRVKTYGYDHLLFALLDAVVDEYFLTIGRLSEDIEELENSVLADKKDKILTRLYRLKREVLFMHRSMWPLREAIGRLAREYLVDSPEDVRFLTANLQQDVLQVIEAVDTLREMLSEMLELYMGRKDLRMNEVGQLLTVVATIFIPLTFITGYFGMNFTNMPLIEWKYGYETAVGLMLVLSVGLYIFFKRKRWLKTREDEELEDEGEDEKEE